MKKLILVLITLTFSSSAFAIPVPITINTDAGSDFTTTGLSGFQTGAGEMNGMEITAFFSDNSSETAIMGNTTAAGTGWGVSFTASTTFENPWTVSVSNVSGNLITSMLFSGAPGDTVFDIVEGTSNTNGSATGHPFQDVDYTGSTLDAITATYINRVLLNGVFFGDLYESVRLDFFSMGGSGGLAANDRLVFETDTDNSATKGGIKPVPEPASLALFALGIAGLGITRRRKSA